MDDKENSHQNPPKKTRPSLSLSKQKRFQEVSEEELSACKKPKSANSERSHQWAFRVYELWVSTVKDVRVGDLWGDDKEKLCNNLCKFVEVCQSCGKPYTPKTLLQLLTNLQSVAFERNENAFHFMNYKDVSIKPLYYAEGSDQKKIVIKDVTNCTFNFHLN